MTVVLIDEVVGRARGDVVKNASRTSRVTASKKYHTIPIIASSLQRAGCSGGPYLSCLLFTIFMPLHIMVA